MTTENLERAAEPAPGSNPNPASSTPEEHENPRPGVAEVAEVAQVPEVPEVLEVAGVTEAGPEVPGSAGDAEQAPTTWWASRREPAWTAPSGPTQEHLHDVLELADEDARRRVVRAEDLARAILDDARRESATMLDHARASADRILAAAQAQGRQERAEASREADAVLRRATQELQATLEAAGRADGLPMASVHDPVRERRLAKLVHENAELARRLRRVNDELIDYLGNVPPPPDGVPTPLQQLGPPPAAESTAPQPRALQPSAPQVIAPETIAPHPTLPQAIALHQIAPESPAPEQVAADPALPLGVPSRPRTLDQVISGSPSGVAGGAGAAGLAVHGRRAQRRTREPVVRRPSVRGRWGRWVYRARYAVLAVAGLIAVGAGVFGPAVVSSLSSGGFDVPGSESALTLDRISATVGRQGTDVVALYTSSAYTVDSPQFRAAVQAVYDKLPTAGVNSKADFWTTNSPAFVSTDRRSTYLALQLTGSESQRQDRFVALQKSLTVDPAVASTQFGGVSAIDVQISDQVSKDLARAETISAPVLTVLLVVVFASLVAAGLPLLIGGLTVIVSFLLLRGLTQVTDISVFAINIVTVLGLGLSIDYALLIVSRFREEQRAGHDTSEALARTMTTAGRSVAISATTVAASLLGLLFFPMVFLRSMAYGGVAAVSVAAIGSLTVLPALIGVLGHRVNSLRIPLRRARPAAADLRAGAWERLARSVMRRPVIYTIAVSALLVSMALPILHVRFGGIDARQLPVAAQSRVVNDRLASDFSGIQLNPIDVLVEGGGAAAAEQVRGEVAKLPNVKSVTVGSAKGQDTLLAVDYVGESVDAKARAIVSAVRDLAPPSGSTVLVGGYSAQQVDLRDNVASGLWKMAALTFAVTFLLLFWAFGSFVLPIKAIFMNLLAVGASLGVVVLVFQDGYLSNLLQFSSTGTVELTQPILVLAILFGVSTDYEVFLLSRIREHWDATRDNTGSVATGVQHTGPIITSAAALILVVIAAFSTSQIIFIKLIGVGMFVAILLDSTIVRALLVPATMRLLGHVNWWAPGPILRFWERHRPASESLDGESLDGEPLDGEPLDGESLDGEFPPAQGDLEPAQGTRESAQSDLDPGGSALEPAGTEPEPSTV